MSEPLRFDAAAEPADLSERDRDARVEVLLVSGLDHYFNGQHELAINVWTRVLFLDRGHARARAYIERARSAAAERQREGEELLHAAAAAFDRGDADGARRLLTSALERGAAPEDAFALLDRVQRLETAGVQVDVWNRHIVAPADTRRRSHTPPAGRAGRLTWIAAGAVLGMLAALAVMVWAGAGARFVTGPPEAAAPARVVPPEVPIVTPAEIMLDRAQQLYDRGRLREALPLLEGIPHGDPLRPRADELRAQIQQQLLDTRQRLPAAAPAEGVP